MEIFSGRLFLLLLQVYMFDFQTEQWMSLPPMQIGREDHGCGLIQKPDGTYEAIVAGGHMGTDSVELYNFETQTWR